MDAGANMFDDQMPDMDEIGMTAFQDAMANGARPKKQLKTVVNAISQAGEEFGVPPEMMEAGINAGMEAFNEALANGDTPEGFGTALDAVAMLPMLLWYRPALWIMLICRQAWKLLKSTGEMGGMTADMMEASRQVRWWCNRSHGNMPPEAMGGMDAHDAGDAARGDGRRESITWQICPRMRWAA